MNKKVLTAVIVDDEPLALEGLKLRLEQIPEIEVIGEGVDGEEAIKLCQLYEPDVLFIDIQMPGLTGIEVVQAIQSDVMPIIVFVSAYGEYAIEAFELSAIDYILKPANFGRLQKTVQRILAKAKPQEFDREKFKLLKALGETSGLTISEIQDWLSTSQPLPSPYCQELVIKNDDHEKEFLTVKDIRWIDAAGDYMCIHIGQETHVVRITMKKLTEQLNPKIFQRIHKSTLVNINCIKSICPLRNSESMVELNGDVKLKVSRNYSAVIQRILDGKQL